MSDPQSTPSQTTGTPAKPAGDPEVIATLGLDRKHGPLRRLMRWASLLLLLGAAVAGGFAYVRKRAEDDKPTFETATAEVRDIRVTITATGTLRGLNTVEVGAEVSGKVTAVHVDWNDPVTVGQVLAEIDPEQLQAALAEASARVREADASIRQAQATLAEAHQNRARGRAQAREGLVAQRDLDALEAAATRAEATLASARAGATLARAALDSAKSRLEKTRVLSPIQGIVLSRLVEPGQTVTAGFQTPVLFKLAEDLRRMALHVFIDEADIGRAREGQAASFTVDAYPGQVFPSTVQSLRNEPQTEQNVVTYEAVLAVDNDALKLRPGMTATATIVAGTHTGVLAVPNAALRFTPPSGEGPPPAFGPGRRSQQPTRPTAKKQVWVLKNGTPSALAVVTGASDGAVTEIVDGELSAGTEVLVDVVEKR